MSTNNSRQLTFGGVSHPIEDTVARASIASINEAIVSINAAIDALTGTDDVTQAIDTMNEVIAFLDNIRNTDTLVGKLNELRTAISEKYTKPGTGIPKSDLASDVQTSLGKADTALQSHQDISGKADFTQFEETSDRQGATPSGPLFCYDHEAEAFYAYDAKNDVWKRIDIDSLSQLGDDSTHRTVTDAEKTSWGNKQNALTFDDVPTANSNNPVKSGGVFNSLQIPVVEVEDTDSDTEVTQALNPNTFYDFTGDDLTVLDITLVAGVSGCLAIYAGKFTAHANGCTFSYPNTVTAADSVPQIEGGETYEFNIMDGVLMMVKL